LLSGPVVANAQQYTLTDLPFSPTGISSNGEVTGDSNSNGYPVVYKDGITTELGFPGAAYDVNASGQVVGYGICYFCGISAFLYSYGAVTYLAGTDGIAYGINDSGTVVGADTINGSSTPFIYQNGSLTQLPFSGSAQSINNSGQVAGYTDAGAYIYSNGNVTVLGTPSGTFSYSSSGYGINNLGQVVGWSTNAGGNLAQGFFYSNGKMNSVGFLKGTYDGNNVLYAVNDSGQAVGNANNTSGSANVALLYANGKLFNLNTLTTGPLSAYVTLTVATGINDLGQIIADGIDSRTGDNNGYLLTPVSSVPVPATAWLLLSGLVGVGLVAHRRRVEGVAG
jgi:probable HAF family extracellular repeat protein